MGLEVLDVAIGLVVVYLVLALVCTTVVEMISQSRFVRMRAKILRAGLERMMGSHATALLEMPEIRALSGGKEGDAVHKRTPSYIPSETFGEACAAFLEEFDPEGGDGHQGTILQRIRTLETSPKQAETGNKRHGTREIAFAQLMRRLWMRAKGDRAEFVLSLSQAFEDAMARVGGEYRSWARTCTLVASIVIVVAVDADTVRMTKVLYQSPEVRAEVVAQAEALVAQLPPTAAAKDAEKEGATAEAKDPAAETKETTVAAEDGAAEKMELQEVVQNLRDLDRLLGWGGWPDSLPTIIGLLISALAVSMGAPFWFRTLQTLLRARARMTDDDKKAAAEKSGSDKSGGGGGSNANSASPGGSGAAKPPPTFAATFEPSAIAHSDGNAFWLGKMAELAYQDKQGFGSAIAACKPEATEFLTHAKGTQVHVASWENYVIVAFRGTEKNVEDFWTDAQFQLTEWPVGGKVHKGIAGALDAVWDDLAKCLDAFGVRKGGKTVWMTGHSLGGMLAVLAASRLLHEELGVISGIYTIGQPRVGDKAFVDEFHDAHGGRYFRYVNHRDVGPRVPPRALGYHHTGDILYFDSDGNMEADSVLWTRLLDVAFGGDTDFKVAAKESVGDHASTEYVERLRRQLG